jgi:PmbA protein
MDLTPYAETLATLLKSRPFDAWEIMVSRSRDLTVEVKGGKLDAFRCAEPFGVAVRVQQGTGLGFSFSTAFDNTSLERMVDGAQVAARMQSQDPYFILPRPGPTLYPQLPDLYDPELGAVSETQKIERALELERRLLAQDPRLKRVRKCSYGESVYDTCLLNSHGMSASHRGSYVTMSVSAVAEADGAAQIGFDFGFSHRYTGLDPETIAQGAGRRAIGLLGARPLATMHCPAVLTNYVASQLLDVLSASFLAENVHKGKSLLAGRTGERICASTLTIRDRGLLPDGMGTAPCDGEGVPQQDTLLVREGVLQGFLYDSYWGNRMGHASTGNAVRGGIKGPPKLGVHNLCIEPGRLAPGALLEGIERGVLITEVMGMHSANAISGDFSVGAAGYYLEGGKVAFPVKGIAIAGNVMDLFGGVEAVADDLRFFSSVGSPSLRVAGLDISGT